MVLSFWLNIYYVVIIAWALYYLFNSFTVVSHRHVCSTALSVFWVLSPCFMGHELFVPQNVRYLLVVCAMSLSQHPAVPFLKRFISSEVHQLWRLLC